MGGRYIVTGTQLGMMITLCHTNADKCNELIDKIVEDQFLWHSEKTLEEDMKELSDLILFKGGP